MTARLKLFMLPALWPSKKMFKIKALLWPLCTLLLALIPISFWHFHNSAYPLNWDSAHYMYDAFNGYNVLLKDGFLAFLKSSLLIDRHWRGTLTPVLFTFFLFIFKGKLLVASIAANLVFFSSLCIAVFKICRLYLSNFQSLLLTVVILNTPWVFSAGFYYMSELLYFSFGAWCIFYWLQSNLGEFSIETNKSLIFFSLSLMIRPVESLLFLGILYLFSVFRQWKSQLIRAQHITIFSGLVCWMIIHLVIDYRFDFNSSSPVIKSVLFLEILIVSICFVRFIKLKSSLLYSLTISMITVFLWYFLESKKFIGWLMLSTFGSVSNFQSEFQIKNYGWSPFLKLLKSVGVFPVMIVLILIIIHFLFKKYKLKFPTEIRILMIASLFLPFIGLATNNDETRIYFANFLFFFWGSMAFLILNFRLSAFVLMLPLIVYFRTNLDLMAAPGFQFNKDLTAFGFSPHMWPPRTSFVLDSFLERFKNVSGRVFFLMTQPLEESGLINEINPLILTVVAKERGLDLNFEDLVNRNYDEADFPNLLNTYSYILLGPEFDRMRFVKKAYGPFAVKLFSKPGTIQHIETFQLSYQGQNYPFTLYKVLPLK